MAPKTIVQKAVEKADFVFFGEVMKQSKLLHGIDGASLSTTFRVEKSWKGVKTGRV